MLPRLIGVHIMNNEMRDYVRALKVCVDYKMKELESKIAEKKIELEAKRIAKSYEDYDYSESDD